MRHDRIEVTQENIDAAKRDIDAAFDRSMCCPIAQALKPYYPRVSVGGTHIHLEYWNLDSACVLPPEAQAFVKAFDAGETVHPFEFVLSRPD